MLNFIIQSQGKPRVNGGIANVVAETAKIVAIEIDMHSKWCEVESVGSDENGVLVGIGTNERSIHLNDAAESNITIVQFPDHKAPEWDVFVAECSRYTLRVVLIHVA